MRKLSFLVRDLGHSQLAYRLIRGCNRLAATPGLDVAVFCQSLVPTCLPTDFAVMQFNEAFTQGGVVVATDLTTAAALLRLPGPSVRAWWMWDLDWLRGRHDWAQLRRVYGEPSLRLLARSASHAAQVARSWGREPLLAGEQPAGVLKALGETP